LTEAILEFDRYLDLFELAISSLLNRLKSHTQLRITSLGAHQAGLSMLTHPSSSPNSVDEWAPPLGHFIELCSYPRLTQPGS
jgi:hypothetical protein